MRTRRVGRFLRIKERGKASYTGRMKLYSTLGEIKDAYKASRKVFNHL
jgi:hypothetical protein